VNGSPNVRPATREAVLDAIEQLRYTPNRAARTLVTRRTDTIALVVSESETRVFSDPFFPSIVRGISTALAQTELQLLLLMARDDREHAKVERYVRQGHVDGVILMSLHGDDPLPKTLPRLGVPTVLVGRSRGTSSSHGWMPITAAAPELRRRTCSPTEGRTSRQSRGPLA